jgi:hypothetical protein
MSEKNTNEQDEMLPEYDLDHLPIIARGPGHEHKADLQRLTRISLAPDVARVFPDEEAVNQALRLLMRVAEAHHRHPVE